MRDTLLHPIVAKARQRTIVSADHFELGEGEPVDGVAQIGDLVYCADFDRKRLLFTRHADPHAILASTFLYDGQYHDAQSVVSAPFERLPGSYSLAGVEPTFVFSIGRCGSTLLSQMLNAIGVVSVSEPDIYSQVSLLNPAARPPPEVLKQCFSADVAALSRHVGPRLVIKLRSQCNRIPNLIAGAVPEARCVFILRKRAPWAKSVARAFGANAERRAQDLRRGVLALDQLMGSDIPTTLLWYEDIVSRPMTVFETFNPGATILPAAAEALAAAAARDSQSGTPLARENLKDTKLPKRFLAEFEQQWQALRPVEALDRLGIEDRL